MALIDYLRDAFGIADGSHELLEMRSVLVLVAIRLHDFESAYRVAVNLVEMSSAWAPDNIATTLDVIEAVVNSLSTLSTEPGRKIAINQDLMQFLQQDLIASALASCGENGLWQIGTRIPFGNTIFSSKDTRLQQGKDMITSVLTKVMVKPGTWLLSVDWLLSVTRMYMYM
jgi:hypothetical protein